MFTVTTIITEVKRKVNSFSANVARNERSNTVLQFVRMLIKRK